MVEIDALEIKFEGNHDRKGTRFDKWMDTYMTSW